jgi:hypothetical protein
LERWAHAAVEGYLAIDERARLTRGVSFGFALPYCNPLATLASLPRSLLRSLASLSSRAPLVFRGETYSIFFYESISVHK